jgi:hypothetical protein
MLPKMTADEIRSRWLAQLLSTEPADRPQAHAAVRDLYTAAGFEPPRYVFWFDSPFDACWANVLLTAPYSSIWPQMLAGLSQVRAYREKIEQARAQLCETAAEKNWDTLLATIGRPMGMHVGPPKGPLSPGATSVPFEVLRARIKLYDKVPTPRFDESDALFLAENRLFSTGRGVLNSQMRDRAVNSRLAVSFFMDYSFCMMADDEQQCAASAPPAILSAAWAIARSSGPWWPYDKAAVLTDRPSEMHLNQHSLLHRGDGPAAVYRDGTPVYAWNGKPLPARWILQQDELSARELKDFDADFGEYVIARLGTAQSKPAKKTDGKKKTSAALKLALPDDPAARLDHLRRHNQGSLPLLDRYAAGEHEKVWKELIVLGPAAREDPHAADALAVVYETMRRVEANVKTITARLKAMNYEFKTGAKQVDDWVQRVEGAMSFDANSVKSASPSPHVQSMLNMLKQVQGALSQQVAKAKQAPRDEAVRAHVPPEPQVRKQLARLEKLAGGPLPLSLRVFYEVVGSVDWIGRHPSIAPDKDSICPDPLVVFPLDDALEERELRMQDEEGDREDDQVVITIAPDDLHKADTSGGEPYEIAVPDPRADGELLNERHRLFFVDYLRLCFRFGGFPGYEGIDRGVPAEIEILRKDLLAF